MTLTAPGCQMGMMITQDIQDKLLGIPGCDDASVEIVWDPPWTPHMMTEARKEAIEDRRLTATSLAAKERSIGETRKRAR